MTADAQAKLPPLELFHRYLAAKGWMPEITGRRFVNYKIIQADSTYEVFIAKNQESPNWERSITDAITSLSQLEGTSYQTVLQAIASVRSDVIKSKLPDHLVANETIGLETASRYIEHLRKLMVASAAAEISRRESFVRPSGDAIDYGRKCRFAHTFQGSFGFVVESPMRIEASSLPLFENEIAEEIETPFERKVVTRLASGLRDLNQAAQNQSSDILVSNYENGLNANMLDEIVALHQSAQLSAVSFEFVFSPELRASGEGDFAPMEITFEKTELAEEASKKLRVAEEAKDSLVVGVVTQLRADIDREGDSILHDDRKIVVKFVSPDGRERNVHVLLGETNYRMAISAHDNGNYVSVKGKLEKVGRYWYLTNPKEFKLLS